MAKRRKPTWHQTGRWCFTITLPGGKRQTIYDKTGIRSTDKARAREWMETTLEALEERKVTGGNFTVSDLRLAYLTWADGQVTAGLMAAVTFDGHRKQLKHVVRAEVGGNPFGLKVARDLRAADVDAMSRTWDALSPTTVRNRLASLQTVLNWSAQPRSDRALERLLESNPVAKMEMPKAVTAEGRYAPSTEVKSFLDFVDEWAAKSKGVEARFDRMTALLIRIAAETGCRPGEMCVTAWEHFRPEKRVIVLPPNKHKTGRKTGRSRVITLSPELTERIEALRSDPERHPERIFTHKSHSLAKKFTAAERRAGAPWNSSSLSRRVKVLRDMAVKAGVLEHATGVERMHLYKLRHTWITNAVQGGESISDVAGLVGNSARMTETVYLHHQIGHMTDVADRIASRKPQ